MPLSRPAAHDLDALRAEPHRVLHRALHRTAEHDALFELLRDRIGDQLRVELGLADLLDVHMHRNTEHLLQRRFQRLDVFALLADHDTRTRGVDRDARILGGALDHDAADRSVAQLLAQEFADFEVLKQHAREGRPGGEPARAPVTRDGKTEAGGIDLLTHGSPISSWVWHRRPSRRCDRSACQCGRHAPWRGRQSGAASRPSPPGCR